MLALKIARCKAILFTKAIIHMRGNGGEMFLRDTLNVCF